MVGAVGKSLVIVESPAKARTISGFLGKDYVVESSIGHVRDLPKRAADIPAAYKKMGWARLGVDVENGFSPLYIVDADKKDHIKKLKELLKKADELLLATDEDREGESIAWHLLEILKPKGKPVKRMVFHEITKTAIAHAIENPRTIDQDLVDAQEARRILDRLYGYEVSPVLWKKVMPRLSAGRVQSVATRIIVDRERERRAFHSASYWDITGMFHEVASKKEIFDANIAFIDGKRIASSRDFDEKGKLKAAKKDGEFAVVLSESDAKKLSEVLKDANFRVKSVESKPNKRTPPAPFMTSTLQQEAGRKLRFSASRAMRAAQKLYEGGYITYMRTDSTNLSDAALNAARKHIEKLYGKDYLPSAPRVYKKKVKNAQEAHEAIRPAGDTFRSIEEVAREVGPDEGKIYEMVWKRTIASQMEDARGLSVQVRIEAPVKVAIGKEDQKNRQVTFSTNGYTITFPGFQRAYVEGSDDPSVELEQKERRLPKLEEGQELKGESFEPKPHETLPPPRFTEASLVRRLEELGVGRPSTYASIISTVQDRGYVWKKGSALVPSFTAFVVVSLLEQYFGHLVDYAFTARMEDELDAIARGDEKSEPWLRRFYFGNAKPANDQGVNQDGDEAKKNAQLSAIGLKSLVEKQLGEIDARAINTLEIGVDPENNERVDLRVGRYGPYLQRGEDKISIPDDIAPDQLSIEKALELLSAPSGDRSLGSDSETGSQVYVKTGRYGAYVQLGEDDENDGKPKRASLFQTMAVDTITLEEALRLLSLPRTVGADPSDGETILAQNGRYGPYISKGKDSRSLENEEKIFSVTIEEALKLLAEPKRRGRQAAAAAPLKELGDDVVSGKLITLRKGRYGFYVTDGETNASLRSADDHETITPERAQELLQLRRDKGPTAKKKKTAKKKAVKKKTTKKATTKKAAAKKTTAKKKATTKKTAAKKKVAKKG